MFRNDDRQDNRMPVDRVLIIPREKPFLTVITRCYARPNYLRKALDSIEEQTCNDYEHIFLVDEQGRGVLAANRFFYEYRHLVRGKYVYMYDDDTYFLDNRLFEKLKVMGQDEHGILFFKNLIGGYVTTGPWLEGKLGLISGNAYAVLSDVWKKHILAFHALPGNPAFNRELDAANYSLVRIDTVGVTIQKESRGIPEKGADPKSIADIIISRYKNKIVEIEPHAATEEDSEQE